MKKNFIVRGGVYYSLKSLFFTLISVSMLFSFAACSNGDDKTEENSVAGQKSGTVTTGKITSESVIISATGVVSVTADSSGSHYEFTKSNSNLNANISSRALTVDESKGGTWKFFEGNSTNPKYSGTYKGDISEFTEILKSDSSSEGLKLELTVTEVLDSSGNAIELEENDKKSFDFEVKHTGGEGTFVFEAEIPAFSETEPEIPNIVIPDENYYDITIDAQEDCYVQLFNMETLYSRTKRANGGEELKLQVTIPIDEDTVGHAIDTLTITKNSDKTLVPLGNPIGSQENTTYYAFTMPNDSITIKLTYKEVPFRTVTFAELDSSKAISFTGSAPDDRFAKMTTLKAGEKIHVALKLAAQTVAVDKILITAGTGGESQVEIFDDEYGDTDNNGCFYYFYFIMPDNDVTVSATFKDEPVTLYEISLTDTNTADIQLNDALYETLSKFRPGYTVRVFVSSKYGSLTITDSNGNAVEYKKTTEKPSSMPAYYETCFVFTMPESNVTITPNLKSE